MDYALRSGGGFRILEQLFGLGQLFLQLIDVAPMENFSKLPN